MPSPTQNVRVELATRSYDIQIGSSILDQSADFVTSRGKTTHAVIITDDNVHKPHAIQVGESLGATGMEVEVISIEPGELSKSIEMVAGLWQALLDIRADRRTAIVAVGGGVVGDLAGFLASTYARGLRFFQVPTSLLAQVDSSVGGKVGINLPDAKNMVGSFYQPTGVLIDTDTLKTLPDREYISGLGEVVKYGMILDPAFFEFLEKHTDQLNQRDAKTLVEVVARCCRLKADVVEKDEREETGLRAVLNYGHTFCHAFETLSGYGTLLHGEAVSLGMVCAARLAARLGRIDDTLVQRQYKLLEALKLPVEIPSLDPDGILDAMQHDKKVVHGQLRFILPSRLGHVELVSDIDPADILASLKG